jgi:hypothetical protein
MKVDAWTIWRSLFRDGDEIFVITEDDEVVWGKLKSGRLYCHLSPLVGKKRSLPWDEIRFAAHDGFPVKKLLGPGTKSLELEDTTDTQAVIREVFSKDKCGACGKLFPRAEMHAYNGGEYEDEGMLCAFSVKSAGRVMPHVIHGCQRCYEQYAYFGDPFAIEDFSASLLNAGLPWTEENDNWEFEEMLVLQHKGGARGILCDLSTIYHWE